MFRKFNAQITLETFGGTGRKSIHIGETTHPLLRKTIEDELGKFAVISKLTVFIKVRWDDKSLREEFLIFRNRDIGDRKLASMKLAGLFWSQRRFRSCRNDSHISTAA
jgi:hypothetical protein